MNHNFVSALKLLIKKAPPCKYHQKEEGHSILTMPDLTVVAVQNESYFEVCANKYS